MKYCICNDNKITNKKINYILYIHTLHTLYCMYVCITYITTVGQAFCCTVYVYNRYKCVCVYVHGVVSTDKNNVFRDMYKTNAEIHTINTRQSLNFHICFTKITELGKSHCSVMVLKFTINYLSISSC
jgi:hypothetical protein